MILEAEAVIVASAVLTPVSFFITLAEAVSVPVTALVSDHIRDGEADAVSVLVAVRFSDSVRITVTVMVMVAVAFPHLTGPAEVAVNMTVMLAVVHA